MAEINNRLNKFVVEGAQQKVRVYVIVIKLTESAQGRHITCKYKRHYNLVRVVEGLSPYRMWRLLLTNNVRMVYE